MEILIFLFVIFLIFSSGKKNKKGNTQANSSQANSAQKYNTPANYTSYNQSSSVQPARTSAKRTLTAEERARLNNYRSSMKNAATGSQKAAIKLQNYMAGTVTPENAAKSQQGQNYTSVTEAIAQKTRQKQHANIVEMAKSNNERLKEDVTLEEIEQEHGHSEAEEKIIQEHSRNCQSMKDETHAELAVESYLGSTEDLITMGYSGNLQNQRDFLEEAQDFLTAISMPNTAVPDYK